MQWGRVDPATNKRRSHWFGCTDQQVFAMAGVWKDSEVPGFALLSCPANALLKAAGCTAMPVIFPAGDAVQDTWLHGGWDRAGGMLAPYASSMMTEPFAARSG
jgi:putative SOS response-associated peptidase YedK